MGDAAEGPLFGRDAELGMAVRRARAEEFDGRRPFRAMAAALGIAADAIEPERRELAAPLAGSQPDQTEPGWSRPWWRSPATTPIGARVGAGHQRMAPRPSGMLGLAWLSG